MYKHGSWFIFCDFDPAWTCHAVFAFSPSRQRSLDVRPGRDRTPGGVALEQLFLRELGSSEQFPVYRESVFSRVPR